ncbi:hypothetical protein DW933_01835 [Lachnospira eligens]|uniref:Type IV secretory pathway, VirB10 components n=1 Tax=Lachnospira eligens TaxID=39485 RepID=A0A415MF91_9FIRM|nr:hypothetical protein DW933_01835 [Lachnospira eligens]RHL71259.1 hypothetical protein DW007_03700 [Lachnospira eligens]
MNAKVKKTAVGVFSVAIVAGSVFAGTSLKAGAYSKTQDVLNELLGAAKPYGVVAEEFKNSNHNQTCFATNKLVITDQWMSAWLDMSVGTTYIKSFDNSGSSEVNVDRNAFNNLVLGTDYDYEPRENKYYIKDSDGKRTGAVINVANCKDTINVYYAEDYMDVTAALDNVYDNFKAYADTPDSEADIVIGAYDDRKIDLASFKNKQIVVVNMYANNYIDWQGKEVSSYYGEGQLNITNKAQGQFVIINLLGGDGDADIKRFSINGKNTGGLTDVDVSDTVIFNAVNVTGNINIGEVCGIVVAPKADITLTSTCNGRAISKSFVNVNGQMHFISDNQQQETTQKETTSVAQSSSETTKSEETTTAQETTKSNETTTAQETTKSNETTTAQETTKSNETTTAQETTKSNETTVAQETTKSNETTAAQETTKSNETTVDAGKETKPTKPESNETTAAQETTKSNETTVDAGKETKPTKPESNETTAVNETTKSNETTVDSNKQTKEHTTSSTQVTKKTGEVAGDEELVTGKEDETVGGSRVRKTGEVAADEEVVKTGDNNHVWVYIVILVAAAVISGTVIVISKKSNKR